MARVLGRLSFVAGAVIVCLGFASASRASSFPLPFVRADLAGCCVSATDQEAFSASLSGASSSYPGRPDLSGSVTEAASVSIPTGAIHVIVSSSGDLNGFATAQLFDVVTFHGPNGSFSGFGQAGIDVNVDGVVDGGGAVAAGTAAASLTLTSDSNATLYSNTINMCAGACTGNLVPSGPFDVSLGTNLFVLDGQSVGISMFARATGSEGGLADLSHTAQLGITLPQGWSFTSASGELLTSSDTPPAAVAPEPATLVLAGPGLTLVLLLTRRSRVRR